MSEVKVKIKVSPEYFLKAPRLKNPPSYLFQLMVAVPIPWMVFYCLCFYCHTAFSNPNHPPPSLRTPCHYIGTTWIIEIENLPISRSLN